MIRILHFKLDCRHTAGFLFLELNMISVSISITALVWDAAEHEMLHITPTYLHYLHFFVLVILKIISTFIRFPST